MKSLSLQSNAQMKTQVSNSNHGKMASSMGKMMKMKTQTLRLKVNSSTAIIAAALLLI